MRGELVFNLGSGLVLLVVVEPAPAEAALPALGAVSSSTTIASGLGTTAVVVPAHGKDEYNRL
jgi:membrane protein DedA with SNARE-associated domain